MQNMQFMGGGELLVLKFICYVCKICKQPTLVRITLSPKLQNYVKLYTV